MTNAVAVPTTLKQVFLDRFANSSPTNTAPSKLHAGSNDQSLLAADTDLVAKLPKSSTTIDACDATTGWTQAADGSAVTLNTTTGQRKEGTGSLNLPVTYSTGSSNWSKTISSTNFTTNKYLLVYLYLDATAYASLTSATDTVSIQLGTGGFTNYHQYNVPKTSLKSGSWTLMVFDTSSPSSTGGSGATLSAVDRAKISVKSGASIAAPNMRMDWWHQCAATDFDISLQSGYPAVDLNALTATYRGKIAATEMNNYDITNVMLKNSLNVNTGEAQFNQITKTNKIQVTLQPTIKVI